MVRQPQPLSPIPTRYGFPFAAAMGKTGGIVLAIWGGELCLWHIVGDIGKQENRADYDRACSKAKAKLARPR